MAFDRSPAELLWVPKDAWGPFGGTLLNLSYGYGKIFVVPHELVNNQLQGGMCQLPIPDLHRGWFAGVSTPRERIFMSAACSPGPGAGMPPVASTAFAITENRHTCLSN